MHQAYLELLGRLRDDLPSRTLAAAGFTGLLLWGIDGIAAVIWLAAFAINEGLELLIGMKSSKDPEKGALNRKLFCANIVFGASVWVAGALALVRTGEIGPLIIALAILIGALTHVISTNLSYLTAFLAGALPLVMGNISVPAVMIASHAYEDSAVFQASVAMVFLLTYSLSAAYQSWQRETKLAKTLEQVSLASDAKSQFLATMSHEIRTPLNGIVGLAEVLNNTQLTTSQQEMVNLVRTSGETLERLVSDVLDSAKIEADKLELSIAPFDLRETIETAARTFRRRAEEKGVAFNLVIQPEAEAPLSRVMLSASGRSSRTSPPTPLSSPKRAAWIFRLMHWRLMARALSCAFKYPTPALALIRRLASICSAALSKPITASAAALGARALASPFAKACAN